MKIAHARHVTQAIRSVRTATQESLKALNRAASQRMAKGDYSGAEVLASKGKAIRQFQSEVDVLLKRWREVCGARVAEPQGSATPLWVYYQPILQSLVHLGGESRRGELEEHVQGLMSLQPGDRTPMARGRERWRVMVHRARKALVAEGWIEDRSGLWWRITNAGRRAAENPIPREVSTTK